MIQASELRIGNAVNAPHGIVFIREFVTNGVRFTDGCGGNFASLDPIHLTPEILVERCGFEKQRHSDYLFENIRFAFKHTLNFAGSMLFN